MGIDAGSDRAPYTPTLQKLEPPFRDTPSPPSKLPMSTLERSSIELEESRPSSSSRRSTDSLAHLDDEDDRMEKDGLLESQTAPPPPAAATPHEYSVPLQKKLMFLALYFVLNLGLTLSNKGIMTKIKTPWLLTVCHATATSIGSAISLATGQFKLSKLSTREHLILVAFSCLFTLNIAISNVSLALVSVPFHQIARATSPVVTVGIYRVVFQRSYELQTYLSMIPLILGVAMATIGDVTVSLAGFVFTAFGVLLASTKTVTTNRLMTGPLALGPLEILLRMSPLAALQCLVYAAASGEYMTVGAAIQAGDVSGWLVLAIMLNAAGAFLLNTVSFQTNKLAGALTISICGNLKQCLTIVLGIALFSVKITILNGFGIFVALCGAAWYSRVELLAKSAKK